MRKILKTLLAVTVVSWAFASPASAAPITFSFSSGDLAASAEFDTSGTNLVVTLTNTGGDVLVPADLLTALFFDINGVAGLGSVSAVLDAGSTVLFDAQGQPPGGVVGGEWAYLSGLAGAPGGATEGIGSSGFGLFGGPTFPGDNLDDPVAVDGFNYALTSCSDNTATGNSPVTGGEPLIQCAVVFTLSGLPAGFDPSAAGAITNVSFQYGTALNEPNFPPTTTNQPTTTNEPTTTNQPTTTEGPEPAMLTLLGAGLVMAGRRLRRRKAM